MSTPAVPRWLRALVSPWIRGPDRAFVLQDLQSDYQEDRRRGRLTAALWYLALGWRSAIAIGRGTTGSGAKQQRGTGSPRGAAFPRRKGTGGSAGGKGPRSVRMASAFRTTFEELAHAARQLRRTPGFTSWVVVTLALGIGSTTAVFSVVNGVLLTPLPYAEPERLVRLYSADEERLDEHNVVSGSHYLAFRERDDLFASLAAFYDYTELGADLSGDSRPERIIRMPVSHEFFAVLGAIPVVGRTFAAQDEVEGARVAVISHELWTRRFGRQADVVGRSLVLDDSAFTILGVTGPGFVGPNGRQVDVWTPLDLRPGGPNNFDNHYLSVVGRLGSDASRQQVAQALNALNRTLADDNADARLEYVHLIPLHADLVGDVQPLLIVLMAAVGTVLLIACINVANLSLMRGAERVHELAVRAALGARRRRLVAQLLAESLLRAVCGGIVGVVIGSWSLRGLLALSPEGLPRVDSVELDANVLLFAGATTMLSGLVFAIVPAMRFSRPRLGRGLRAEGRSSTSGRAHRLWRGALVVGQIASVLVLLFAAGLLIQSFVEIQRSRLGIEISGVTTFEVHLPAAVYSDGGRRVVFSDLLLERLSNVPGVETVGAVSTLPVTGRAFMWGLFREDVVDGDRPLLTDVRVVAGDYYGALGIELAQGRVFGPGDHAEAPPVVLVNQQVVDTYLTGLSPIGARVRLAGVWREIVGVVANAAVDPRGSVAPKVYMPYRQAAHDRNWGMTWLLKSAVGTEALLPRIREAVGAIDPDRVVYRPSTMAQVTRAATAPERFSTVLMGAFGAMALLITAVGIYGMLAVSVGHRHGELGIRAALGADPGALRAIVLRQALKLAALGVGLGAAVTLSARQWLLSLVTLPELDADWMLGVVAGIVVLVALAAGYLPARRATAVDPAEVLRSTN